MTAAEPDRDVELLRPADVLAARWAQGTGPQVAPPEAVILCHQAAPLGRAVGRWHARPIRGFQADVRLLRRTGERVGVATRFGVGAPATGALVEELAAFGVRRFVSLGLAGGLTPSQHAGELLVVDGALREEGTSGHYLPPGPVVDGSAALTDAVAHVFERQGRRHIRGLTSTTDTPYRTTRADVDRWTRAGALAVEMEVAGLFAVARRRGVDAAAVCCIADALGDRGWHLAFDGSAVAAALRAAFQAVIEALA